MTYEELTSGDDPVIRGATLRQNVYRGNIQSAHRGGGEGGYALYIYSSFPEKYKQRWVERNGDPEEQMHKEMIRSKVQKTRMPKNSSNPIGMTKTVKMFLSRIAYKRNM